MSKLEISLHSAQTKTGPGRTPDRPYSQTLCWLLEVEPSTPRQSKRFLVKVFAINTRYEWIDFAFPSVGLAVVDFPTHLHLLDRLPDDVGTDLPTVLFI